MKKSITFIFLFLAVVMNGQVSTWDGGGATNNWSEAANWVNDVLPTDGDDIIFSNVAPNGTKNCTIDQPIVAGTFSIGSAYTGVITGGVDDIVVGTGFIQQAGTFNSSTGTFYFVNPNSGTTNVFSKTGGVWNHNGGVVDLQATGLGTITISGTFTFNTLNISVNNIFSNPQRVYNFGTTSRAGNMTISGSKPNSYTGVITLTASLNNNNNSSTMPTGSTATFSLNSGASVFALNGPINPGQGYLPNITFSTSANQTMSGNINIIGTWNNVRCGTLLATGTSTVNFYGANGAIVANSTSTSQATRRPQFHNLTIQTGASVTLNNQGWIEVTRNLTNNGTFTMPSNSGVNFRGTSGSQQIGGTAAKTVFGSILRSNNTSTITLNHAIDVLDSIRFVGTNGRLNTNGNILTLKSSASLKARIARTGTGTAVNSIIGNIRVENFVSSGSTGWTNLGVSGVTGNTIANWDGQFPMTCNGCTNGTTTAGGPFASICFYNETLNGGAEYVTASSSNPINPGTGLWVYMGTGQVTTNNVTITVSGGVSQGSVSVPITRTGSSANPGYNLVANPYPSPIRWQSVYNTAGNSANIHSSIHVYNPDIAATSVFNAVTGLTTGGAGAANCIPMGQGFYVEKLAVGSGNIVFAPIVKTHSNTAAFTLVKSMNTYVPEPDDTILPPPAPDTFDRGSYFRLQVTGFNGDMDDAIIHFHNQADIGYDIYDAHKMFQTPGYLGYPGPYNKYTTISTRFNNEDYSMLSLEPSPSAGYQIPLLVKAMQTGNYAITPLELNNMPNNVCISLYDKLLNVHHDLKNGAYNCVLSDTVTTPRFVLTVCPFSVATGLSENASVASNIQINKDINGIYVDFDFAKSTDAKINVTNILGQTIMNTKNVKVSKDKVRLDLNTNDQLIFVTVETENEKVTRKFITNN